MHFEVHDLHNGTGNAESFNDVHRAEIKMSANRKHCKTMNQNIQHERTRRVCAQHEDEIQELTEVVPLVASTAPVIVGSPVVSLEVGVLRLHE